MLEFLFVQEKVVCKKIFVRLRVLEVKLYLKRFKTRVKIIQYFFNEFLSELNTLTFTQVLLK